MKGDFSRLSFDARRRATDVLRQQGRVDLDADWNEQRAIDGHLRRTVLADVIGAAAAPMDAAGFGLTAAGADLRLGAGRIWVGGVLCENDAPVSVFDQPDLPNGLPVLRRADGQWVAGPAPAGVYAVALEVWQQHRSAVEDPTLREVALGGPDTTTRLRTVWQARLLHLGAVGAAASCASEPAGWLELTAASSGTLRAWANPDATPPSDCLVPLSAPYRGLDNQLYRVEIMQAGEPGAARYVWSRDNGAVAAAWIGRDGDVLTLRSPGRDGSGGFAAGCWVQLTDDTAELRGAFGTLAQVDRVEGDRLVLKAGSATGSLLLADFPRRPRVRRWDGWGVTPPDGSDVALELGVMVAFGTAPAQRYRVGDWWSFAARAATRDVDWPRAGAPAIAVALPPHGPPRWHAKLGVAQYDGSTWTMLRDCRDLFAPLADQRVLLYLGGDGQAVMPGSAAATVALPQPLAVAVTMGGRPLPNARVRFAVTIGTGRLNGGAAPLVVTTDATGEARCTWSVDSVNDRQEVAAALLDDADAPAVPTIRFGASLLRAKGVAYDPAASPILAGVGDVQGAIDRLAALGGGGCSTLVLSPGPGWVEALQALPAGRDATVCFRPGVYRADGTVVLRGLGHLRLTGAGEATRIQVAVGEAALRVEDCDGVAVEDLALAVQTYQQAPEQRLNGVLTLIDCGAAEVRGCMIACPSALDARGTCLTVRNAATDSRRLRPAVTVEACNFAVGYGQTGVLVVNGGLVRVARNRFRAATPPAWLTPDRALAAPMLRGPLVQMMVGAVRRVAETAPDGAGFNTVFRVGEYVVRMNSSMPVAAWAELVRANPPGATEATTPEAVGRYVEKLAQDLAARPQSSPTLARSLLAARRRFGTRGALLDGPEGAATIRAMLGAEEVQVARPAPEAGGRGVQLRAGATTLRFDSALPQRSWDLLLREDPLPQTEDERRIARHLRRVARRLLADATRGVRVAPAFVKEVAEAARGRGRGIVVGGAFAPLVEVEGNVVDGLTEGVHVATSAADTAKPAARPAETVRIRGNEIALASQPEGLLPARGIFVGNSAARVAIEGNRIVARAALAGIEVFGRTGPHLVVRDNMLEGTRRGVLFRPLGAEDTPKLWVIADNIALGGVAVVAPPAARVTGNVP